MHRILAAEVQNTPRSDSTRNDRIREILEAFDLHGSFEVNDVATTATRYRALLAETNAVGQLIQGYIDHLLILPDGRKLIIDHKIFPRKRSDWEAKALSYSGQLGIYADAADARAPVVHQTAIHLVTTGASIRLGLESTP